MADQKITELTELTTPAAEDLLPIVDDPGESPATKKITAGNLMKTPFGDNAPNITPKASAYRNAALNIADQSWTEIVLDVEIFDIGSDFNTSTGRFTAPVTGYYMVTAFLTYGASLDQRKFIIGISIDATNPPNYRVYNNASGSADVGISLTKVIYLTSGQTLSMWTWHYFGGSTALNVGSSGAFTGMDIHLVST